MEAQGEREGGAEMGNKHKLFAYQPFVHILSSRVYYTCRLFFIFFMKVCLTQVVGSWLPARRMRTSHLLEPKLSHSV